MRYNNYKKFRFEEESKVFKAVYHAIKETLLQSDLVRETEKNYKEDRSEEKVEVKKEESVVNNIVNNNDEKKNFCLREGGIFMWTFYEKN